MNPHFSWCNPRNFGLHVVRLVWTAVLSPLAYVKADVCRRYSRSVRMRALKYQKQFKTSDSVEDFSSIQECEAGRSCLPRECTTKSTTNIVPGGPLYWIPSAETTASTRGPTPSWRPSMSMTTRAPTQTFDSSTQTFDSATQKTRLEGRRRVRQSLPGLSSGCMESAVQITPLGPLPAHILSTWPGMQASSALPANPIQSLEDDPIRSRRGSWTTGR